MNPEILNLVDVAKILADEIAARKERAKIYQPNEKEEIAKTLGMPLNFFHSLPYSHWQDLWKWATNES